MSTEFFKKYMALFENRLPDTEYTVKPDRVIAQLKSYNSQSYTKLGQKLEQIDTLSKEIKKLQAEVKSEVKDDIAGIFIAEDAVKTRVVETLQFIFTLSKDPKATETPKYKDILTELEKHLTPELIVVLESLKKTMKTVTEKSPSLTYKRVDESATGDLVNKYESTILNWAEDYDDKLYALKQEANSIQ